MLSSINCDDIDWKEAPFLNFIIQYGRFPGTESVMDIKEFYIRIKRDIGKLLEHNCHMSNTNDDEQEKIVSVFFAVYSGVYKQNIINQSNKNLINEIVFRILYDIWEKFGWQRMFFLYILKFFPKEEICFFLSKCYGKNMQPILDFFVNNHDIFHLKTKHVKTIGLYYPRIYNGGVERFISCIIPIYLENGYKVILYTDVIDESNEYPIPSDVKRVVLGQDYIEKFKILAESVKNDNVDIMCNHYVFEYNIFFQTIMLRLMGIPVIYELHGLCSCYISSTNCFANVFAETYVLANHMVVLSRVNKTFWESLGYNCSYIPNPLPKQFDSVKAHPFRSSRKTILWAGRIESDKGFVHIFPIMQLIVQKHPDVQLVVVGAAPDNDMVQKKINEMGLNNNIHLMGYQLDMSKFFLLADVMLMTSPAEGFPYVIAEAKLHGLPMVIFELPYLEMVRTGGGIISVPQRDYLKASKALIRILEDDALWRKLSSEAENSIKKFTNYDYMKAWEEVFKKSLRPKMDMNIEKRMIRRLLFSPRQ